MSLWIVLKRFGLFFPTLSLYLSLIEPVELSEPLDSAEDVLPLPLLPHTEHLPVSN
jgi:hypothetical protein